MKNIYLFYGNDHHSIRKEVKKWITGFIQKNPDSPNLNILKEKEYNLPGFYSEAFTPPFLGDKRLIICHQCSELLSDPKTTKAFYKKIEELPETTILVFIETKLKKNSVFLKELTKLKAEIKEFSKNNSNNNELINSILKTHNKKIAPNLIEEIIYGLEENPEKIENEINKLVLYSSSDSITADEVYAIINLSPVQSIFKITDQIGNKKPTEAIKTLSLLLNKGEDLMMLFYIIAKHFRNIILIKDLVAQNKSTTEIEKITNLKAFPINNLKYQIKNFDFKKLEQTLEQILKIDTKLKTGKIKYSKNTPDELLYEIERLIYELA